MANTFTYVVPVIALVLAATFLGGTLTFTKVLAAGVVLPGVMLMMR